MLLRNNDDYEIVGWVWLTPYGELKSNGVNVKLSYDKKYFIYNNKKYPPGVYYLIRYRGREYLISERTLKSI
jgi:Ni/Co efflux regulator RcnB